MTCRITQCPAHADWSPTPASRRRCEVLRERCHGSERVSGYYDQANRPMSDYLAALGWTSEPGTRGPR